MRKLIFIFLLFSSFCVSSQNLKKTFLCILDEYIKTEILKKGFNKDSVISVRLDKLDKNFEIALETYELAHFPNVDSIKKYKNVRMLIRYPKEIKKQLSKYFKSISEIRNLKEENKNIIHEFKSNCLFQINKNNEFIIISTPDDEHYYKFFKKSKMKFARKLKFTKDLL